MQYVYLSRRNLEYLLERLNANEEAYLMKRDTKHKKYPCSSITVVTALENEEYYTEREPGV